MGGFRLSKRVCQIMTVVVALLLSGPGSGWAAVTELNCRGTAVSFRFEDATGLTCLCRKVEAALTLLDRLGFTAKGAIRIDLVDQVDPEDEHALFGSFDPVSREVKVLTYRRSLLRAQAGKGPFGVVLTEDLWCSFAAHELTHVVSDGYFRTLRKSRVAEEYLAYLVQFSVLEKETLKRILDRYPDVEPYRSFDEMSATYYLLDPERFAVKCFRHYQSLKDPLLFLKSLR